MHHLGGVRGQRATVVKVFTGGNALAVHLGEPRSEGAPSVGAILSGEGGGEVPILRGLEGHALALAVNNKP